MSDRFRTIARVLALYISDTRSALDATDEVVTALNVAQSAVNVQSSVGHELLVCAALGSDEVMQYVRENQKIWAIKALRILGNVPSGARSAVTLKGAKDAIEDPRVWSHHDTDVRPTWADVEPPF